MTERVRGIAVAIAAVAFGFSISAIAQPDWHYGMGSGMMGGYGAGYGTGPGLMGGYGPGYGMGPGMMGGYGRGYGMPPGGWNAYGGIDLSADQRAKIAKIEQDVRTKHWALMGKMTDARYKVQELYDADKLDAAAIDQQYKTIDAVRRQMIDLSIEARNQINNILSKDQREKLRDSSRGRGGPMPMWGGW